VWIKTLRLSGFRNYEHLEIELAPRLNFLIGPNGSGKTSILEAVSYLAVARSLRGASDSEVIRWGSDECGVSGDIASDGALHTTTLRFGRGGRKDVAVDGEKLSRLSDLVGMLRVAWFCPEDTWLTKGGPAERRKFLDLTLCQMDAAYLEALSGYRRALRQRNEALISWTPDEESERMLDVWTEHLIGYGSRIVRARLALMGPLSEALTSLHAGIAGKGELRVRYRGSAVQFPDVHDPDGVPDEESVRRTFTSALQRVAADERRRGFTLVGPHRDDLEVTLNGRQLRTFGSQGQHRTAAIALKLAEAKILDADGRGVVVLLDDIMSELDDARVASLLEIIGGFGQALVTSTRPSADVVDSVPGGTSEPGRAVRTFFVREGDVSQR
jgi:DNA replication and repair protein RecF